MYLDTSQHNLIRFDWSILQELRWMSSYLNELTNNTFLGILFYFILVPVENFSINIFLLVTHDTITVCIVLRWSYNFLKEFWVLDWFVPFKTLILLYRSQSTEFLSKSSHWILYGWTIRLKWFNMIMYAIPGSGGIKTKSYSNKSFLVFVWINYILGLVWISYILHF